jgi:hypothetical protein
MGLGVISEDAWPELCTCHSKRVLPTRSLNLSNQGCRSALSLFDVLFSRTILVSLDVQLLGDDTHNHRVVLLPLGHFGSSLQVRRISSTPFSRRQYEP